MASRKDDDDDYWNESETKIRAKENFEEDEFGSQLCGVSKSGTARLSQQVWAGMSSDTNFSTDSISGSLSRATIGDRPKVGTKPLLSLISERSLNLILEADKPKQKKSKRHLSPEEEIRILRRKLEDRWNPPAVQETITKILLGHPYSLELYRSIESKTELLDAAVQMGDGNALLAVVLFLVRTLKKSLVYQLLRSQPAAVAQYVQHLTTRLMLAELTDLLTMLGQQQEAAMKHFKVAVTGRQTPERKLQKLRSCYTNHFSAADARGRVFVENYIKLLEWQQLVTGSDPELRQQLFGQPVLGSLAHACRYHWEAPRDSFSSPLALCQQQLVNDRQYQWTVLNVRGSMQKWDDIENLFFTKNWMGSKKLKAAIPLEKVVVQLHAHQAPVELLAKYLELIDSMDRRLTLARTLQCPKVIIDVFVAQRDRQSLLKYKANLDPHSDHFLYADHALRVSNTKWKN